MPECEHLNPHPFEAFDHAIYRTRNGRNESQLSVTFLLVCKLSCILYLHADLRMCSENYWLGGVCSNEVLIGTRQIALLASLSYQNWVVTGCRPRKSLVGNRHPQSPKNRRYDRPGRHWLKPGLAQDLFSALSRQRKASFLPPEMKADGNRESVTLKTELRSCRFQLWV
jgi:hypothetical protein